MPLLREFNPIYSKFPRSLASAGSKILLSAVLSASFSFGATIFDSGIISLKSTDPLQLGRIGRDSVLSTWSLPKTFPGIVNATTSYHYETFVFSAVMFPYIQISVDDVSGTGQTFVSAYLNAFTPNNTAPNYGLNLNYLADPGRSANYMFYPDIPGDPFAFQMVMPIGGTLVVVVNETTNTGVGQPLRFVVEGFVNTMFNDAPEPATYGLFAVALGLGLLVAKRRKVV